MGDVDFTGLEIANEEMRGYFRNRARAQQVLDSIQDSYSCSLVLSPIRHRLAIIGHVERTFWIITDEYGQPTHATDHMRRDHLEEDRSDD